MEKKGVILSCTIIVLFMMCGNSLAQSMVCAKEKTEEISDLNAINKCVIVRPKDRTVKKDIALSMDRSHRKRKKMSLDQMNLIQKLLKKRDSVMATSVAENAIAMNSTKIQDLGLSNLELTAVEVANFLDLDEYPVFKEFSDCSEGNNCFRQSFQRFFEKGMKEYGEILYIDDIHGSARISFYISPNGLVEAHNVNINLRGKFLKKDREKALKVLKKIFQKDFFMTVPKKNGKQVASRVTLFPKF